MAYDLEMQRCFWCGSDPLYEAYHDREWGFPVRDGRKLFEKVCLEGFQSGLSWLTILRKREAFRRAFAEFDFEAVARFGPEDVDRLVMDAAIVRHRGKIESTVNNARRACEMKDREGSLAKFFWRYAPEPETRPAVITREILMKMTTSPESIALSKELKKRGWTFVAPTTMYAFMQAVGLVNDHTGDCFVRPQVELARQGG